jgi:tetratricopeptide (TPR) repeat protein
MTATATIVNDYDRELAAIDDDLDSLTAREAAIWNDAESVTRLAFRRYHRASLTGSFDDLGDADTLIRQAIDRLGPAEDLCLLAASVDLKTHRVDRVEPDLAMAPTLADRPESWALIADAELQRGRYASARHGFESALDAAPNWDNMARVAHYLSTFGEIDKADDWYACAQDELTAKQMRSYSWIELQRGRLDLERGRYDAAHQHYEYAANAFSGSWLVTIHVAALNASEGNLETAARFYRDVLATHRQPEHLHALGDVLTRKGRADEARGCYDEALREYLDSVNRGEVHYLHHLVDLYNDSLNDPRQAIAWAERDVALRPCWPAQAALARALFRSDRIADATSMMRRATASGAVNAQLFATAAGIYRAAGLFEEADAFARRSNELNPHQVPLHGHG